MPQCGSVTDSVGVTENPLSSIRNLTLVPVRGRDCSMVKFTFPCTQCWILDQGRHLGSLQESGQHTGQLNMVNEVQQLKPHTSKPTSWQNILASAISPHPQTNLSKNEFSQALLER